MERSHHRRVAVSLRFNRTTEVSNMENPTDPIDVGPFDARYSAFLETITQLRPHLHRYCARMTGSVMNGEDVVQEAAGELAQSHPQRVLGIAMVLVAKGDAIDRDQPRRAALAQLMGLLGPLRELPPQPSP